jgi:hypothetical protein
MATDGTRGKKEAGSTPPESDQLATGINANAESGTGVYDQPVVNGSEPFKVSLSGGSLDVTLNGTPTEKTDVQAFWEYLRQRTDAITFGEYTVFIEGVLCAGDGSEKSLTGAIDRFHVASTHRLGGADTYELLRAATEAFLLMRCGSLTITDPPSFLPNNIALSPSSRFGGVAADRTDLNGRLATYIGIGSIPYLDRITTGLAIKPSHLVGTEVSPDKEQKGNPIFCDDIDAKVLQPCFIELIWSYWHEEAALVQTINAISLRFQNKRGPGDVDPLANLETHPLRPLANVLWGYVQDEDHRLTVARRSYEYEHQYGLSLVGKAVPKHAPADRRSQFLVAFHTLLHQAAIFYDRSANLTVRADAFPLLNALREVHLVLAEGAHNQFRELPWTARVEMLMQQWLLSRREMREFVGGRPAVPYAEEWMRTVDAMRRLMGWGDTSISNFHDLAITGEKIVLSIRFGDWSDTRVVTESDAAGWAVFWRPEIQRYIHAYQAVTGVDLSAATQTTNRQIDATLPSVLLQQRMARQRR